MRACTDDDAPNRDERLARLLAPRSVAVVGASQRPGWGRTTIENLDTIGFAGEIYPVNPRYDSVGERTCFPSLRELPSVPDAVVFAIPAERVPAGVAEAVAVGVPAAVVYASGFGAAGEGEGGVTSDEGLRAKLVESCRDKIALLGPNCLGSINYARRSCLYGITMPFAHAGSESGLGLVAQSGNMALTLAGANRGVRLTHLISCGNQVELTASDLLGALLAEPSIRALAALIEGVPDPVALGVVLEQAADRDVPVIVLKVGRSELGRAATVAHTGTLSGSDTLYRSFFRQHGAIQVEDLDELLATAALMTAARRPGSGGVAVFASSGGECGLISDLAESAGVELPPLATPVAESLREMLPPYGRPSNPLDITAGGWGDAALYADVVEALARQGDYDTVVSVADSPSLEDGAPEGFWGIVDGLSEGARRAGPTGPVVALLDTIGDVDREVPLRAAAGGVVPLAGLRPGLVALGRARWRADWLSRREDGPPVVLPRRPEIERVEAILSGAADGPLGEDLSLEVVAAYGIATPRRRLVASTAEAVRAASEIGFPVVAKVSARGTAHKTEVGGVIVGLSSPAQVEAAAERLLSLARGLDPTAGAVLVEEQLDARLELIVGGTQDDAFGVATLLGLGGVLTEAIDDVVHRFGVLTHREAEAMIRELRAARLLDSPRQNAPIDRRALGAVLVSVSCLLTDHPPIRELDLNPVVMDPRSGRIVALDALVVLG